MNYSFLFLIISFKTLPKTHNVFFLFSWDINTLFESQILKVHLSLILHSLSLSQRNIQFVINIQTCKRYEMKLNQIR